MVLLTEVFREIRTYAVSRVGLCVAGARVEVLRGTIVKRTYGINKNLPVYISPFLPTIFGSIKYGPPQ